MLPSSSKITLCLSKCFTSGAHSTVIAEIRKAEASYRTFEEKASKATIKRAIASEASPKQSSKEGNSRRKGRSHRQVKNAKNDKDEKTEEKAKDTKEPGRYYLCGDPNHLLRSCPKKFVATSAINITHGPRTFTVPAHVCGQSVRVLLDKSVGAPIISQAMVSRFGLSVEPTPQTGSVSLMEVRLVVPVSVYDIIIDFSTLGRHDFYIGCEDGVLYPNGNEVVRMVKCEEPVVSLHASERMKEFTENIGDAKHGCDFGDVCDQRETLLSGFPQVLAENPRKPERTDVGHHGIDRRIAKPINLLPRRLPPTFRDSSIVELKQMIDNEIVRPSKSPWAAPLNPVRKRDGAIRMTVDYPIELEEADRKKTTFASPLSLIEINVMPFGLTNAPATFQRMIDVVCAGMKWSFCLPYMDDLLVFSATLEENFEHLRRVFEALVNAGLKLKKSKCKFFGKERRAKPLSDLTQKNIVFKFGERHRDAFKDIRDALVGAPILQHPDFSRPFYVQTDASNTGLGAVLAQRDDRGKEHMIACLSSNLRPAEHSYTATKKEALALCWVLEKFKPFIYGPRIEHRKGTANPNADALSRAHVYRGDPNEVGDLEVSPWMWGASLVEVEGQQVPTLTGSEIGRIKQLQREDAAIKEIIEVLESGLTPSAATTKSLLARAEHARHYELQDGILIGVIPVGLRDVVLKSLHDDQTGDRLGVEKILGNWRVDSIDQKCDVRLFQCVFPTQQRVSMDILGLFPTTELSNRFVLVMTEHVTSETWICRFGIPHEVLTGQGPQFARELFEEVCALLGIKHVLATPYRSQMNGMTERFNRTLAQKLALYLSEDQRD
ncbi:uncharacterized protein VTP21DRAFT_5339 [Calcarisporiella thermophila]|uniref:uncharacterized protein n=1 Tax=Calcarisporiella thermophila TaxID=911321 RepID=UPI0037437CBE